MKNKIKELIKKILKFLKSKINIINLIILLIIYVINDNLSIEVISGLWIFTLIGVYAWDWFKKQ